MRLLAFCDYSKLCLHFEIRLNFRPLTSGTLPPTPPQMPSECASEMEQKSPSNMTLSFKRAITSGTSVPHSKHTKLVESTVDKAGNCRKKQLRQTKQSSVVPVSESLTKLDSGFMDVDTPTSSNQLWDEDLQKRKRTSVTKSSIVTSDVSSCSKCEQNEMKTLKDSTTAFMKENGELLVIHPATISSTGRKPNVQANDKAGFAELEVEKMPCGNLTLPTKLPVSNSEKMGFGKQVPFVSSRKRSTAADDCKFFLGLVGLPTSYLLCEIWILRESRVFRVLESAHKIPFPCPTSQFLFTVTAVRQFIQVNGYILY